MTPELAFTGLADEYDRWRPRYPAGVLAELAPLVEEADRTTTASLLDVGAGTGISTRLVRDAFGAGRDLIGVEPDPDMRRRAEAVTAAAARIEYLAGDAEHLPVATGSAVLVLTAQSIQWFDRAAFLGEAARVLRPRGVVAVLQNDRDWGAGGAASAFEDFLEHNSPGYSRHYRSFAIEAELDACPGFGAVNATERRWEYSLAPQEFVAMALTSSKTQRAVKHIGRAAVDDALSAVAAAAADGGDAVTIPYVTRLFWARRDGG